tara:strand:+ start:2251 stop:2571 length:321 start_codon:yes stop_codon:yes gene_type:complete
MKINNIILTTLIILFGYILIVNLIEYNTLLEGVVTLDSSDIESIYTNKQKLSNIEAQQANIEAEILNVSKNISTILPTYKPINQKMIDVTKKAEKEMAKQKKAAGP